MKKVYNPGNYETQNVMIEWHVQLYGVVNGIIQNEACHLEVFSSRREADHFAKNVTSIGLDGMPAVSPHIKASIGPECPSFLSASVSRVMRTFDASGFLID